MYTTSHTFKQLIQSELDRLETIVAHSDAAVQPVAHQHYKDWLHRPRKHRSMKYYGLFHYFRFLVLFL